MNPLKTFFETYKLYVYAAIFMAYSVGLWHVSATYTESKYLGKQLDVANAVIETTKQNQATASTIGKAIEDKLAALRPQTTVINRNITNAITKDPIYTDCKSSPDVMREYQRKLDLQPE